MAVYDHPSRRKSALRSLMLACSMTVMLVPTGCSQVQQLTASSEEKAASELRGQAEAFRLMATVSLLRGLYSYGSPPVNKRIKELAQTMFPLSDPDKGMQLFLSTALVNVARADQKTATVAYYHPWSDVALLTGWSKGEDGRYRITSADVMTGAVLRGAKPPYSPARAWQLGQVYAPEAVGKLTAQTIRAFEAGWSGEGKTLLDGLDAKSREAMPAVAAFAVDDFRQELMPLFAGEGAGADDVLGLWRVIRTDIIAGKTQFTGETADTIMALSKLPPRVRDSIVPVSYLKTERSSLLMLASRIDPGLYLAMQVAEDGGDSGVRQFHLLTFQSFYDAAGKEAKQ